MKNKGRYMAQRMGLFSLVIGYGKTIKGALKKARIDTKTDEFGLFTVRNGDIVRIKANGNPYEA